MIKKEVPVWEKLNLTLEEAAYSGIGVHKLRELSDKNISREHTRYRIQSHAFVWGRYLKNRHICYIIKQPNCKTFSHTRKGDAIMAEKNKGKRLDKNRLKLRKGESQRKNGSYDYRWTTPDRKRHTIYVATLDELREKEEAIISDKRDGIKVEVKRITVNDMFDLWCALKRGIKDNTFQNYVYMYNMFVRHTFGRQRLTDVKESDVRRFYNRLVDERVMSISTIDTVQNILHQVFNVAIEDGYMRTNPTDNMLKELKQSHNF